MSGCGCRVEHVAVADADWRRVEDEFAIRYCPLHGAAERLVDLLEDFCNGMAGGVVVADFDREISEARALLDEIGR